MSHNHTQSTSSSDDGFSAAAATAAAPASAQETHSPRDRKRKAPVGSHSPEMRASGRPRPASWHPSAPVEPPLESMQLPPIAVSSILNPTKGAPPADNSRDAVSMQQMGSARPRMLSSPTPRAHPSANPAKRPSMSPRLQQRPIIAPLSPSARFVSAAGNYPGKPSTAHSSPLAQESRPGMYGTPGSPLPIDPVVVPSTTSVAGGMVPTSASIHSTPTFHSRRTSGDPTPIPSPREMSPSTPQSAYSQYGRSPPALAGMSAPPTVPPMVHSSPYGVTDPNTRFPTAAGSHRYPAESSPAAGMSTQSDHHSNAPGWIPCVLDMKSGSSSQAEKRKANSDASRRFRNRKRNELQMEQKITAQQEEMRKQAEILHRHTREIRGLFQECEYYRSERDFYREQLGRVVPPSQLPARPASPRALSAAVEKPMDRGNESVWQGAEVPMRMSSTSLPAPAGFSSAATMAPVPATRPPGTWTTAPSVYSTSSAGVVSEEQSSRSLPQLPGWTRS